MKKKFGLMDHIKIFQCFKGYSVSDVCVQYQSKPPKGFRDMLLSIIILKSIFQYVFVIFSLGDVLLTI